MTHWVSVAKAADCPPGEAIEVTAGDRVLALFNVAGAFHALDGVCPHQGGPLGEGMLEGTTVTCPWHGWQFDVCSGENTLNPRIVQSQYPVRIEGEDVLVELEDAPESIDQ